MPSTHSLLFGRSPDSEDSYGSEDAEQDVAPLDQREENREESMEVEIVDERILPTPPPVSASVATSFTSSQVLTRSQARRQQVEVVPPPVKSRVRLGTPISDPKSAEEASLPPSPRLSNRALKKSKRKLKTPPKKKNMPSPQSNVPGSQFRVAQLPEMREKIPQVPLDLIRTASQFARNRGRVSLFISY